MEVHRLRGTCDDGKTCPALHRTDHGTVVVVGTTVTDAAALAQLGLPRHESAVEIPSELVAEVIRAC